MNNGLMLVAMAGVMAGVMWAMGKHDEPEKAPAQSAPLPTTLPPTPVVIPPLPGGIDIPNLSLLKVPPSTIPIPGGSYIEGIGWCPPGMAYNLATKLCEPQFSTQGCEDCDHE